MIQILEDAGPYTLTLSWELDGTATDVGDVTIGITDGGGSAVVAALTATTNNADGTYTYSLADQSDPNPLRVTWTRTDTGADLVQRVEVMAAPLFTEVAARAFNNSKLSSTNNYTDAMISDERTRIGEMFERWTGRSWVERYCRVELPGSGSHELWLGDGYQRTSDGRPLHRPGATRDVSRLLSVTVGGVSVTLSTVTVMGGMLWRDGAVWTQGTVSNPLNVVVEYVYGLPAASEGSDRMALLLLVDHLANTKIGDNVTSFSDEMGTMQFLTAGRGRALTNVPELNQWLNDRRPLGVG